MDYDEILTQLKTVQNLEESNLLIALEKLILLKNIPILIHELSVFSGLSLNFIYNSENPFVFLNLASIKTNLKDHLQFELKEIEFTSENNTPFITFPEGLLVIQNLTNTFLVEKGLERFEYTTEDILKNNTKFLILETTQVERKDLYTKDKFKKIKEEFINNFTLAISNTNHYEGLTGLMEFIKDFSNFNGDKLTNITESFIEQFSFYYGIYTYTLGMYYFLDRITQNLLNTGISALSDALMYYREFTRLIKVRQGNKPFLGQQKKIDENTRRRALNSLKRLFASFEEFVNIIKKIKGV
ncbi:MAG: hypothetical protein K6343_00275 [Caldisericaceae bacterium]